MLPVLLTRVGRAGLGERVLSTNYSLVLVRVWRLQGEMPGGQLAPGWPGLLAGAPSPLLAKQPVVLGHFSHLCTEKY